TTGGRRQIAWPALLPRPSRSGQRLVIAVHHLAVRVVDTFVPAGIETLARFTLAKPGRQPVLGLLEREQQVVLEHFPAREILLEGLGAGRRDARPPVLGRLAGLHLRVVLTELAGQP